MNDTQYQSIVDKLDLMSTALLLNLVKDLAFTEQVLTLEKIGLK